MITGVAYQRGIIERPDQELRAGDRYDHWSQDPRIDHWSEVPPDYYGPPPPRRYGLEPAEGVGLVPNQSLWFYGYEYRLPGTIINTNGLGLREEPLQRAPAEDLRIAALGDSHTMGEGLNRSESWPEQLERMLAARLEGSVEVINAGVPGYGTADMYQLLEDRILQLNPDLVILTVSMEDSVTEQDRRRLREQVRAEHGSLTSPEGERAYRDRLERMIRQTPERWRQDNSSVKTHLKATEKLLEDSDTPWMIYLLFGGPELFEQQVHGFADRNGAAFVGPHPVLAGLPKQYAIHPQDRHLNATGGHLLAHQIAESSVMEDINRTRWW